MLKLKYTDRVQHNTAAVFFSGNSPEDWLMEINRWNLSMESWECYVVPVSKQSVEPAGLFLIFNGDQPDELELKAPYGVVGKNLFIPVNAILLPQTMASELEDGLLYDKNLMHPQIGLVGFNTSDQIHLADLLELPEANDQRWNLAIQGLKSSVKLTEIRVDQPTPEDILENLMDLIDPHPLKEIFKGKKERAKGMEEIVDRLKEGALLKLLQATRKLDDYLWDFTDSNNSYSDQSTEGLLGRLENWVSKKLEALHKKQKAEIERLLQLFEENPDEALRYSIPLQGPYAGRGMAPPSSHLSRHNTNFNLNRLGGGSSIDWWEIGGENYSNLRIKYKRTAEKLLLAKDYRKAAYIYAHLLGDYHAAARALVQGRYYREAAVLYKDHLKNIPEAAKCLEQGGLLLEAIELYKELKRSEKAGDLYSQLEQREQAAKHYEMAIEQVVAQDNFLEAVRIVREKLEQPERAKEVLLQGWDVSRQGEDCLKQYFDMIDYDEQEAFDKEIRQIFDFRTPKDKQQDFLNVLLHINDQRVGNKKNDTSRAIAYEILSGQIKDGKRNKLRLLKRFVPEDRMIGSDCNRFNHLSK